MASGTFEKTNFEWQLQQLQQRIGEWVERLLSNRPNTAPSNWMLPEWLLEAAFWLILVALVSGFVWQVYRLLLPYGQLYWRSRHSSALQSAVAAAQPVLSAAEWLQRSRAAQQQGDYRDACRCLYMATLQQLNDRNLIDQELSRTDGEYLQLLCTLDRPQPYHLLIRTHEQLCFSQSVISAELFDRCWQAYQEISQS